MAEMLTPGYAFREYTENIKKGKRRAIFQLYVKMHADLDKRGS